MDDTTPATKADIQTLATKLELATAFRQLEDSMNTGFKKVHEDINLVLDVLINIDKKYRKKTHDHERRIVHLEKTVAA